eukprot:Colp12_sorted_trinity150504_noHs@24184
MLANLEEFQEVLQSEVYVDMEKLSEMAQYGVPDEVRGEVWKYLLGVVHPDKSKEVSEIKEQSLEYMDYCKDNPEIMNRVRGEVKRYHPEIALFQKPEIRKLFEDVISTYMNRNSHIEYSPSLIHLCGPLIFVSKSEADVYYLFEALMKKLTEEIFTPENINKAVADFTTFFRMLQPELYSHFEEEELEPNEWAVSWVQYLFAKELQMECLLRLWDTYFSTDYGFDLHIYVCLAVLDMYKEELEDFEYSELKGFLQRLPHMNVDKIISHAKNIRQEMILQGFV